MKMILSVPYDRTLNFYLLDNLQDQGHEVLYTDHRHQLEFSKEFVMANLEKVDCVFVAHFADGQTYPERFIEIAKAQKPSVKFVALFVDTFIDGKLCWDNRRFIDLMKLYDVVFVVSPRHVEKLRALGVNAHEVFFGYDDHYKLYQIDRQDIDISFIGQFGYSVAHVKREEMLAAICENFQDKTIEIYGHAPRVIPQIAPFYAGRTTYNDLENMRIIARTKVNFGYADFGPHEDIYGYSNRVVFTLGCGGFLLYSHNPLLVQHFVDGEELVIYSDKADMIEKIRYYLEHPEERARIAQNGQKKVLENYTWAKSITNMIKIIADECKVY